MRSLYYLQHAKAAFVVYQSVQDAYQVTYLYRKKVKYVSVEKGEANMNQLSLFLSSHGVYLCRTDEEFLGLVKRPVIL